MLDKSFHRLFISSFILFGRPGFAVEPICRSKWFTRYKCTLSTFVFASQNRFVHASQLAIRAVATLLCGALRGSLGPRCGLALRATAPHRWRIGLLTSACKTPSTKTQHLSGV